MKKPFPDPYLKFVPKRNKYYIFHNLPGKRHSECTGTNYEPDAQNALIEYKLNFGLDTKIADPKEITVNRVLEIYENNKMLAPQSREIYAIKALKPFWSDKLLIAVNGRNCRAYAQERGVSPDTVKRELGTLQAAIKLCFDEQYITRTVSVTKPKENTVRYRWLTRSEIVKLLHAARRAPRARDHLIRFILIALRSGRRKEAILSLNWEDVDFNAGVIYWTPFGRTRTNKKRPSALIPTKLVPHLKRWSRGQKPTDSVISFDEEAIKDLKGAFRRACIGAGFQVVGPHKVTPHVLRHTCVTWMMHLGVPIWEVAGYVGLGEDMIRKHYGHHHPDFQRRAASAF
jgi:integrase